MCVTISLLLLGVRSCYDEGKRVAETLMFDYHRQHGIGKSIVPVILFRLSTTYFSLSINIDVLGQKFALLEYSIRMDLG